MVNITSRDAREGLDRYMREYDYYAQTMVQKPKPQPVDPLAKFDDADLLLELVKRGYQVCLPPKVGE